MNKKEFLDFLIKLMRNEELDFEYRGVVYGVVHEPPYVCLYGNVVYDHGGCKSEEIGKYISIFELLDKAEIEGKKIEEIKQEITMAEYIR